MCQVYTCTENIQQEETQKLETKKNASIIITCFLAACVNYTRVNTIGPYETIFVSM